MTIRLVDSAWGHALVDALQADPSAISIACPFIKVGALNRLLALRPKSIRVVTRFNLADFADGVSDIEALRRLLLAGARVRGIKGLHSKLYVFGNRRAFVTSANLTCAAFDRNTEFGVDLLDPACVRECTDYFERLWDRAGEDLAVSQLDSWREILARNRAAHPASNRGLDLGDFGADAGQQPPSPPVTGAGPMADHAYVKLLGANKDRVALDHRVVDEIQRAGCHRTLSYPKGKRPTGVEDSSLMFIGRMTRHAGTHDIRIFGRAHAFAHEPGIDDASASDMARRPWRAIWPHYIRVHDARFIDGTMADGISLNELMDSLAGDAFASTSANKDFNRSNPAAARRNENPRNAYRQQPAVKLSAQGQQWLMARLDAAFDRHGQVSRQVLDGIPG